MGLDPLAAAFIAVEENADLLRGAEGPEGKAGLSIEGPQGEVGPEGPKGDPGEPGRDGADGKNGKDGRKGDKGDAGPKGDRGPQGPPGTSARRAGTGGGHAPVVVGGIGGVVIQDEGVVQGTVQKFNFTGTGLVASVSGDTATVNGSGGGGGGGATVTISGVDPGAVGPGNFWIRVDDYWGFNSVFIRNATDDGWLGQDGNNDFGLAAYGSDGTNPTPTATSMVRGDRIDLSMYSDDGNSNYGTIRLGGVDGAWMSFGGSIKLLVDAVGAHIGSSNGPALISGTADPSSGLAAPLASLYLRQNANMTGELWLKTGTADVDWTRRIATDPGDIADPTVATAEDVALKLNELMANLRTAGLIA